MPVKEDFRYAEERHLFCVALTQTWHTVTLLTRKDRVPDFVHEFLAPAFPWKVLYGEAAHAPARVCPSCKEGVHREKTGRFGVFLGCSMFPECDYTESIRAARSGKGRLPGQQVGIMRSHKADDPTIAAKW